MSERSYHGATSRSNRRKEKVLLTDALDTFYLCIYGFGHMQRTNQIEKICTAPSTKDLLIVLYEDQSLLVDSAPQLV